MIDNQNEFRLERDLKEYANDPEFIADYLAVDIIEQLLALLKKKGLTQTWLADNMGVSKAHISKLLNAPSNMTLSTIAKMATALGVNPEVKLDAGSSSSVPDAPSIIVAAAAFGPRKRQPIPTAFNDAFSFGDEEDRYQTGAKETTHGIVGFSWPSQLVTA